MSKLMKMRRRGRAETQSGNEESKEEGSGGQGDKERGGQAP